MKVSLNWLNDFVDLSGISPEEIGSRLTMGVVEVEGIEKQGAQLDGIVVGRVTRISAHPDADKLQVCMVSAGEQEVQVVCGGTNLKKGMLVAFGTVGATVQWHGGEEMVLKKIKIRGVESSGMICASDEIGLQEMFPKKSEFEILDLTDVISAKAGTPLALALGLGDVIFDIDNKSMTHRPDLWGHFGLARELSALFGRKLKEMRPRAVKEGDEVMLAVDVRDPNLCPRYMAVVVDGVEVAESPDWMKARLKAVGVNPKNNIVDITNFVMMELGEPMHAFDSDRINTKAATDAVASIAVRRAKAGETLTTLKGDECALDHETLVIADGLRPIALAGIMGGEVSGVVSGTRRIIIESANFDAVNVRRTATRLGLRTDSSARFEKSLDPNMAEVGLRRAVELVRELCPSAKVVSRVADVKNFQLAVGPIELTHEFLQKKLGTEIETGEVAGILERLGFDVKERRGQYSIGVPSWRATKDISIPEDIVEEVARHFGYGKIPPALPDMNIAPPPRDSLLTLKRRVQEALCGEAGFVETLNYSFEKPEWLARMGVRTHEHIELDNPVAKDRPLLRRSLIPNLLENIERNLHRSPEVALFEVGRTFIREHDGEYADIGNDARLPLQDTMLAAAYAKKTDDEPFYELALALQILMNRLGIAYRLERTAGDEPFIHPGRSAVVFAGGEAVGSIAELHPHTAGVLGIESRTAFFEINLSVLSDCASSASSYHPLPQYPSVARDIAFLVGVETAHADVERALLHVDELIEEVELFDVYAGRNIEKGKKSMAYRIVYRSPDRTLDAREADGVHERVAQMLNREFGAEVRA